MSADNATHKMPFIYKHAHTSRPISFARTARILSNSFHVSAWRKLTKQKKKEQAFFWQEWLKQHRQTLHDHNWPSPCEVKLLRFLTENRGNFLKDTKVLLLLFVKPLDLFSGVGQRRLTVLSFKLCLCVYDTVKENALNSCVRGFSIKHTTIRIFIKSHIEWRKRMNWSQA